MCLIQFMCKKVQRKKLIQFQTTRLTSIKQHQTQICLITHLKMIIKRLNNSIKLQMNMLNRVVLWINLIYLLLILILTHQKLNLNPFMMNRMVIRRIFNQLQINMHQVHFQTLNLNPANNIIKNIIEIESVILQQLLNYIYRETHSLNYHYKNKIEIQIYIQISLRI